MNTTLTENSLVAGRRRTECATCHTDNSLIITCQSEQHTFCQDCVTTCFRSRTAAENTVAGLAAGLSCPLSAHCESQLDFGFVRDILHQTARTTRMSITRQLNALTLNAALLRNSRIRCPNEECSHFFLPPEENSFQFLFIFCPRCVKNYCLTCKNSLSSQGYADHICPLDEGITDTDANQRLHEVLTEAVGVRCPNKRCRTSDRPGALAVKEPGDCNTMRCGTCRRYFCFICSVDLGRDNQEAHQAFPHRNVNMTEGPMCWLFNDQELDQTDESALKIRQLNAVTKYLSALQISNDRKAILLNRNRKILGDLYHPLTARLELRNVGNYGNCVVL